MKLNPNLNDLQDQLFQAEYLRDVNGLLFFALLYSARHGGLPNLTASELARINLEIEHAAPNQLSHWTPEWRDSIVRAAKQRLSDYSSAINR